MLDTFIASLYLVQHIYLKLLVKLIVNYKELIKKSLYLDYLTPPAV